jgi:hypothetical protein
MWLLYYIYKLNGLYDILCAISILGINIPIVKNLHLSMFLSDRKPDEMSQRFLAYWIFTYGIIRLYSSENIVIAYSYYIETAFIANESLIKKTMYMNKSYFVICASILLGYMSEVYK